MPKIFLKIIVLVLVVGATGFVVWQTKEEEFVPTTPGSPLTEKPLNDTEEGNLYRNGTYSALGRYISPAGGEEVYITLTIENDVVSEATFEGRAGHPTSRTLQNLFAEGFSGQVIGRPLDEVNLDVVNGSSLTSRGFNEAVEKIRTEAKS